MACYLIHFLEPYHHAKHYLGWTLEAQARVNAHLQGKGARLTQVVHDAGIAMVWVRVWEDGDRRLERKLKNRHSPELCPICRGLPVQMPLMPWMPAYVPQDDARQTIDYAAELEDLVEAREDETFWAQGFW